MLLNCFISYLCMRVLKLTLGKIFFYKFSSSFNFPVWKVQIDLDLCLDAYGFQVRTMLCYVQTHAFFFRMLFLQQAFGQVSVSSGQDLFWVNIHVPFTSFLSKNSSFSRGFIPKFWHSLHISSHSQVFSLTSLILLSFGPF